MKTFYCDHCGSLVFFENTKCLKCGHSLGFLPDVLDLTALEPASGHTWIALAKTVQGPVFRLCQNGREYQVCNWLVPAEGNSLCVSCGLNKVIPDLSVSGNLERWQRVEQAKRRLIYTLLKLRLPLTADSNGVAPLRFCLMADPSGGPTVFTGHEKGVITLNIAEADDAEREKRRVALHEPYRALLGHFRHEIGHYYWDVLVAGSSRVDRFRELFGDETQDYGMALKRHHDQGAPADWQERMVSAYSSAHPWEDWAETWAHYLHIVDAIETAAGFGIALKPKHPDAKAMTADLRSDPGWQGSFAEVYERWVPLTSALNCLSRGMGLPDLYPFVLSNIAVSKLTFIHGLIQEIRKHD